eukprot:SAG31_NODE_2037_length_6604_cov_2.820600_5_plen_219_part_00
MADLRGCVQTEADGPLDSPRTKALGPRPSVDQRCCAAVSSTLCRYVDAVIAADCWAVGPDTRVIDAERALSAGLGDPGEDCSRSPVAAAARTAAAHAVATPDQVRCSGLQSGAAASLKFPMLLAPLISIRDGAGLAWGVEGVSGAASGAASRRAPAEEFCRNHYIDLLAPPTSFHRRRDTLPMPPASWRCLPNHAAARLQHRQARRRRRRSCRSEVAR